MFSSAVLPAHQLLPMPDAISFKNRILNQVIGSRQMARTKPDGLLLTPLGPVSDRHSDHEGLKPWSEQESNLQHPYYQYGALPIELSSPDT